MAVSRSPVAGARSIDIRTAVLDAALRLFTERGYFNTSVHEIGAGAGVSIGAIYHHFKDKEGIAAALYQTLLERMEAEVFAARARQPSTGERCHEVVARLFELTETEPQAMAFIFYARHQEFLPDAPPICSSRPFEMLKELVAEGMDGGEVRPGDPLVTATCLFGGPIRLVTARLDGVVTEPLPQYLDAVWALAWRAVAAP